MSELDLQAHLPELYEHLLELARGVRTYDEEGTVYKRLPDRHAAVYLIDRMLGRPGLAQQNTKVSQEGRVTIYLPHNGRDELSAPAGAAD